MHKIVLYFRAIGLSIRKSTIALILLFYSILLIFTLTALYVLFWPQCLPALPRRCGVSPELSTWTLLMKMTINYIIKLR